LFEKIAYATAFAAVLFLVFGLLVTMFCSWIGRRTAHAIEAAAGELGLARVPAGGREGSRSASFEGVLEGVSVRIGSVWRFVKPIASRYAAYVNEVRVTAALPHPLPFRLEIRRHAFAMPRTLTLFDSEFDRNCAVVTDDSEATRDLLAPSRLRSDIRSFLKSRVRLSRISSESVATTVFDAHTKGAPALIAPARQAASLARELSTRGSADPAPAGSEEQDVDETRRIPNLVTILETGRVRIEKMTSQLRTSLWQASFRPSGKTVVLSGEPEMIRAAEILAAGGALFGGDHHGWPPAAVLLDLQERGQFPRAFTEIRFRGPRLPVLIRHRGPKPPGGSGSISTGEQS